MMDITVDTQLMHNQKHAVVMEPGSAFSALQTKDGDTVFFSTGTDGVFYATREVRKSDTGWTKLDISSSLSTAHHNNKHVVAKSFVVSQNPQTFAIDILLVVTVDNSDFLYASLNHSGDQNSWDKATEWTALPYDAIDREGDVAGTALEITGIYLTNVPSITGATKVVDRHCCVDIVDPTRFTFPALILPGPRRIARYYIHLDTAPRRWIRHTLPVELDPSNVSSCFGRRPQDMNVPGIYTFGEIEKRKQLIFTPQRNVFDSGVPPTSARLSLPNLTTAIASIVDSAGYTSLFLAAQEGIYLFTPSNQRDRATPKIIIKASSSGNLNLLTGISSMAACTLGTRTVMWCINSKAELIQAYCPLGKESIPEEWSSPVIFSEGVSRFAFYLNVTDTTRRDILFAQQQDRQLQEFAQDSSSGSWSRRQILLPATSPNDVVEYNSFTTHIRLTNHDGTPVQNTTVEIEASSAVTLYINNVYHVLSPDMSVEITPDPSNTITVIQETHSLSAATLLITVPGSTKKVIVDPMATASAKLAQIKSGKDLGDVKIKTSDGKNERPLIPAHVSTETKNTIAAHLAQLLRVKDTLPTDGSQKSKTSANVSGHPTLASAQSTPQNILLFSREKDGSLRLLDGDAAMSHLNTMNPPAERNMDGPATENRALIKLGFAKIFHYASDLVNFALHAWDEVTHFIVKQVGDFWEWSLNIAGKVYHAILDSVSAVVGAIQVLFSQIEVFFKDLVAWLGFLFDWDDIKRTHDVVKNIVKQYCNQIVKAIDNLEHKIDDAFHDAQKSVNAWAGLPEDGATIGAQNAKGSGPGSISAGYNTPQANWGLEHFKNGMTSAETSNPPTSSSTPIWQDLEEMLNNEEKILLAGADSLKTNVADPFFSLTSMQVVKRILGILGSSVLASAGNIILKLFDILKHLIQGALESLDAPVEFPIISWMYEKITGKQLKLSILDLICFICAIPATIIFKAVTGAAPYPDDKHTKDLIDAPDFETITRLLKNDSVPNSRMLHGGDVLARAAANKTEPLSKIDVASAILHLCAYPGAILSIFVNVQTKIDPELKQSFMVRAFSAGAQFLTVVPNILGQVIDPLQWENIMNSVLTLATFAKILADTVMGGALNSRWADRYSAILESILGVVGTIPPFALFIENKERRDSDYVSLTGNLAYSVAGTFTFATESTIMGNGPVSKVVIAFFTVFTQSCVGVYSVLSFTTGELLLEGK